MSADRGHKGSKPITVRDVSPISARSERSSTSISRRIKLENHRRSRSRDVKEEEQQEKEVKGQSTSNKQQQSESPAFHSSEASSTPPKTPKRPAVTRSGITTKSWY